MNMNKTIPYINENTTLIPTSSLLAPVLLELKETFLLHSQWMIKAQDGKNSIFLFKMSTTKWG